MEISPEEWVNATDGLPDSLREVEIAPPGKILATLTVEKDKWMVCNIPVAGTRWRVPKNGQQGHQTAKKAATQTLNPSPSANSY